MAKKQEKKYFLPIDFPTSHLQANSNMPFMTEHNGLPLFWGGGNSANAGTDDEEKKKGSGFAQGMTSMAGSSGSGVGAMVKSGIDEQTTDSKGYQDPMDARAAGYWSGSAQGAQMGSSAGPWGMLIGAAIGGIYGGISGNAKAKKKNKALGEMQQEQNQELIQNQVANPYARANGGPLLPEMDGYNTYKGNTHENGGIPIGQKAEVETGEVNFNNYIYSDRLTPIGKKATFADMAKRIRAKYKGREEDKAGKFSMERDLSELAKQNDEVRTLKEQEDILVQRTQEMQDIAAYGGCIKYENGGLVLDESTHNKMRRVAKKRGIEFPELIANIYSNTQKFALGGYNDFGNQYGQDKEQLNLINQYPDGGPMTSTDPNSIKMTPAEWDAYNAKRGWSSDPREVGSVRGYKSYFDPKALNISPSSSHESGYELKGLSEDALSYGMPSPKYHQSYNYKPPVMKVESKTPTVLPTSNRTAIGFDTIGTTYRDNNTGETYMLDRQGNVIPPLTKANGGPLEEYNNGGLNFKSAAAYKAWLAYGHATKVFENTPGNQKVSIQGNNKRVQHKYGIDDIKKDPNLSKYSKEDLKALGYDVSEDTGDNGFKFGNEEGALLASSLPAIYNLIKGSKSATTKFDRVKPEELNLSSQRKGITQEGDRAKRTALEIARSVGGGSGSVLAALSAMNSNINQQVMNRLSDSYSSEANTNVGIRNQAKYTNTNISMQEKIANEQNQAMADSLIGHGLSNLGTNAQMYSRDKKLSSTNEKQNERYTQIINQIFPDFKWGQDPKSDALMIQFVNGLNKTE